MTTLLITTFNRSQLLEKSLERLTHLTIPDEVLIVDDGSTDATEQVCKGFMNRLPLKYIYNHNPKHSICSFARNIGIKNTGADTIITSEPELLFVTDIVKQMEYRQREYPEHIISVGTIYHGQHDSYIGDLAYTDAPRFLKESIVEDYQIEPRPYNVKGFCKTVNMQATFCALYKKKWLMDINGWNEGFPGAWGWDDIELCTRLRLRGINQVIAPEMEAIHQFHEHLPPHIWGKESQMNEEYLKSEKLDEITDRNDKRLIANKGKAWGMIQSR